MTGGGVRHDGAMLRPLRRRRVAAWVVGAALGLTGCAAQAPPVGPVGVDEVTVPTPQVDPDDFVAGVDHPWLRYEPGRRWRYRVTENGEEWVRTVTVGVDRREVAGVAATPVRTTERGSVTVDLVAQDRDGHVWWLGRAGEWRAGQQDPRARAGLLITAVPRFGDGYRAARVEGRVDERVSVAEVDGTVAAAGEEYDAVVVLDVSSPHRPGEVERRWYAEGTGLVRTSVHPGDPDETEPRRTAELIDTRRPGG